MTCSGVIGGSFLSDLALDDVSFRNCGDDELPVCNYAEFTCSNNRCIPQDKVCDLVDDCWDGSDENDCGKFRFYYFCDTTSAIPITKFLYFINCTIPTSLVLSSPNSFSWL